MPTEMKIRKIATITLIVISSFAANSVTPSKTDLETMYDKAFSEFDANNHAEALKGLDAIDARQPDLAESQNLRGVIMMRQKEYAQAETALKKALAADPKFWNARFNLAEIPFLQKNWTEARKRFQELLTGNASELQGEATQLIQYKILLTYLLEGKENMVDASMAKFELAPDTPAVHYANAALALNKKDENGAKEWLTKAEKAFSPQLNKLFAESLYEVGWLEKPAGHARAALELSSAADRAAQTQEFAEVKYEQAEQALAQRDFTAARKLVDEANGAAPNDARILNLRGEILLEQKEYDLAENEFRKALKADPKSRDAQFNLAQVPFKKKEYSKARDRFESLFSVTSGADKDQAAQLIKFKIFLTLLLEGKDARAQKMMEQFQFTGDTPALYYAQAAMEFKNNNTTKANEWVTSARKIYSPALNGVFSESFFDVGWLQSPGVATSPAPMVADADQAEIAPSIEPTPLPAVTLAQNTPATTSDPLTLAANSAVPGMEATTSAASAAASTTLPSAGNTAASAASPSVETPVASTASPAAARPVVASAPDTEGSDANETSTPTAPAAASTPATVLAPAQVREWSQPNLADRLRDGNTLLVAGLLMAAILLLGWVVLAEFRRRMMQTSGSRGMSRVAAPAVAVEESVGSIEQFVTPQRLAGGPPQVSLQLRASEPALRRGSVPVGRSSRLSGNGTALGGSAVATPEQHAVETEPFVAPAAEAFDEGITAEAFDEGVGEPVVESDGVVAAFTPPAAEAPQTGEPVCDVLVPPDVQSENFASTPTDDVAETPVDTQSAQAVETAPAVAELPTVMGPQEIEVDSSIPLTTEPPAAEEPFGITETIDESAVSEPVAAATAPAEPAADTMMPAALEDVAAAPAAEEISEPIGQGQPIPYQIPAFADGPPVADIPAAAPESPRTEAAAPAAAGLAGIGALRHSVATLASAPRITINEPTSQQPTIPAIMPPTIPTPSPMIRTAPPTGAPQPTAATQQPAGGAMHTAVQLTFSFEIASLQLTSTFKMGALQLRPTSKIVTMRLAPSQHPQPAMNLQVTFEIGSVQLNGSALGVVRLTPSQQQRPGITSSPSFNIAGLQLVSGAESAPVQLTPSQQGQASVLVTAGFQIMTVDFSPTFEIASIILNSTTPNVNVQLPGTGPSAVEGAPVFEIASVQLGGSGEIAMMQLNQAGSGAKRA